MTWSYSGDPSSSAGDTVHFLLGDTDSTDPLLQDEEIAFLISEWDGNLYFAAAAGAEKLAEQFAREVSFSGDGANVDFSSLSTNYAAVAQRLRKLGRTQAGRGALPYAGGISQSDVDQVNADNDRVPTAISMGMHDNYREGGGDPSSTAPGRGTYNPLLSDQSGP